MVFEIFSFFSFFPSFFFKKALLEQMRFGECISPLLCFELLKFEDLTDAQKMVFFEYYDGEDHKVCRSMFPFFKTIRKRKIVTFLMAMKRITADKIPKQIRWKILDYAYSPLKERG